MLIANRSLAKRTFGLLFGLLVCALALADAPPNHETKHAASRQEAPEPKPSIDSSQPNLLDFTITPYSAVYQGTYNGRSFGTEGHAELIALGNNQYRARVRVKNFIIDLLEESTFYFSDGVHTPQEYRSRRDTMFTKRHKTITFDWENQQVHWRYRKNRGNYDLPAQAMDAMTMELAISQALKQSHEPRELQFLEADHRRIKERVFYVRDEEMMDSALGMIPVIRVEQVRADDDRSTSLWLSPQHNYLLIRGLHLNDGDRFELTLVSFKPG